MPRALPWLTQAASPKLKQDRVTTKTATPARPAPNNSDSDDLVDADLNPIHPSPLPKQKWRLDRDPSTSPPAAPSAPPEVDFMREGYNADDIWRMVEDEFYSTAQSFTRHIHRAEYIRLKKLAKSRGAGTLRSIARAIDRKTKQSEELRLKLEADDMGRKRRAAAVQDGESASGEEDEDDYMQDPQLAGLMTGDMRSGKDLLFTGSAQPKTRAAAGFLQSPRNAERTRDVFNDGGSTGELTMDEDGRADKAISGRRKSRDFKQQPLEPDGRFWSKPKNVFKQFARNASSSDYDLLTLSSTKPSEASVDDPITSLPSPTKDNSANATKEAARDYLAKRRADKERREREEKKRKANSGDSIPTFLF